MIVHYHGGEVVNGLIARALVSVSLYVQLYTITLYDQFFANNRIFIFGKLRCLNMFSDYAMYKCFFLSK